jgi:hypothetical protein
VVDRQRERRPLVVAEVVVRGGGMVEDVLRVREREGVGDAGRERDADEAAGVVAHPRDGVGRDRAGRVDQVGLALAVGGVVNENGLAAPERVDAPLDAARGGRGVARHAITVR